MIIRFNNDKWRQSPWAECRNFLLASPGWLVLKRVAHLSNSVWKLSEILIKKIIVVFYETRIRSNFTCCYQSMLRSISFEMFCFWVKLKRYACIETGVRWVQRPLELRTRKKNLSKRRYEWCCWRQSGIKACFCIFKGLHHAILRRRIPTRVQFEVGTVDMRVQ